MDYNQTEYDTDDIESNLSSSMYKLRYYVTIIIEPIGTIGNIISLIILTRIYLNRKSNICILYTILCGLNIINNFNKNKSLLKIKFDLSLQANYFIQYNLIYLIAWMQVLIGFHRFIYVVYQSKAKILEKKVFKLFFLQYIK